MGDEAYGRHFFLYVRGNAGHHIAPLVEFGLHSHLSQLIPEHFEQCEFLHCRRLAVACLVGLRVHGDIAQESVFNVFHRRKITFYIYLIQELRPSGDKSGRRGSAALHQCPSATHRALPAHSRGRPASHGGVFPAGLVSGKNGNI